MKKFIINTKYRFGFWIFLSVWNIFSAYSQPNNASVDIISVKQGVDGLEVSNFFLTEDQSIWLKTPNCLNICYPQHVENIYFGKNIGDIHSNQNIVEIKENIETIDIFYQGIILFYDRYDKKTKKFEKIFLTKYNIYKHREYLKTVLFNNKIYIFSQTGKKLVVNDVYKDNVSEIDIGNLSKIKDIIVYETGYYLLLDNGKIFNYKHDGSVSQIKIVKPHNYKKYTFNGKTVKQKRQIFYLDSKNRLWYSILGYPGVFVSDKYKNSMYLFEDLPINKSYVSIAEDKTGKLLFGSTNRYRFTGEFFILDENNFVKEWPFLISKFNLPKKIISDDFYDEMFVSTYRNLIILNFKSYDFFSKYFVNPEIKNEEGGYGNIIWGISQINDDSIFVTSDFPFWGIFDNSCSDTEISRFDYTRGTLFFDNQYCKKDSTVWIKARIKNTLQLLKVNPFNNEYEFYNYPEPIYSIATNGKDKLYCGSKTNDSIYNILYYDPNNKSLEKIQDITFKPSFMKLDSSENVLWCSNYNSGIYKVNLDNDINKIVRLNLKRSSIKYWGLNFGTKNRIYIYTSQGLFIWDIKKDKIIKQLSVKNGLSANNVCSAQEDINGNLWISTFSGLNYYNVKTGIIQNYYIKQGLPNDEFNLYSSFKDSKNNIYFGSANGLIKIDIEKFYNKRFSISLSELDVFSGNECKKLFKLPKEKIKIHRRKISSIQPVIVYDQWRNKDNIRFFTKLSPNDDNWSKSINNNNLVVNNLQTGEYTLNMLAVNDEGLISNMISVSFEIYEKLYEKLWFLAFILLLVYGSLIFSGIYYYKIEKERKEKNKLQFEKKVSELELGILQGQMNPHFVFNSIGAIQGKINCGDDDSVTQYLNDFANLMRLYLESSRSKTISLSEEIEMLKLYINLEKMRFEDKIHFEINVDSNIDTEYTSIPSMILQPFVENAIKHGLFHKTSKGHLKINIVESDDGDNIIISIIDDGVGRKRANEIYQKSFPRHKSRATKIIEERIEVLKKMQDYFIEIEVKDLYDDEQNACGTAVYITIPK